MVFRRLGGGGSGLTTPKTLTFILSFALVLLAVASLFTHLPSSLGFVDRHRFWLAVAGYLVLMGGVLLPRF